MLWIIKKAVDEKSPTLILCLIQIYTQLQTRLLTNLVHVSNRFCLSMILKNRVKKMFFHKVWGEFLQEIQLVGPLVILEAVANTGRS